jgi:hypothetical protein
MPRGPGADAPVPDAPMLEVGAAPNAASVAASIMAIVVHRRHPRAGARRASDWVSASFGCRPCLIGRCHCHTPGYGLNGVGWNAPFSTLRPITIARNASWVWSL